MSRNGMGVGAFNNNDEFKSVTDAVSQVLNSQRPATEMPDGIEMLLLKTEQKLSLNTSCNLIQPHPPVTRLLLNARY
jgi:hypothetical protein